MRTASSLAEETGRELAFGECRLTVLRLTNTLANGASGIYNG